MIRTATRLSGIEVSLIRQINALATPLSANLGIGEPNLEPDEELRAMARDAATSSWKYTANAGTLPLRKLIAEGTAYDPQDEVCVTAGTEEALYAIFQAFLDPGDEVLVPDPGFVAYPTLATLCGATVVRYPIEPPSWSLTAGEVRSRVTSKTKLIVVNTPSNPLGSIIAREELEAIARENPQCVVVSDEVYSQIWYDVPPASMAGMGANTIVVSGMSKSHGMTGLLIGWVLAQRELMKPIITAHQYIATCASAFSQRLAELVLANATWNAAWLSSVRAQFRTQREVALSAIERELEVAIEPPQAAFYAFVPVPACDTLAFARTLATDAAVLVIPGIAFGDRGEGFVRISYAAPLAAIGTGIERIGRWLRESGR